MTRYESNIRFLGPEYKAKVRCNIFVFRFNNSYVAQIPVIYCFVIPITEDSIIILSGTQPFMSHSRSAISLDQERSNIN